MTSSPNRAAILTKAHKVLKKHYKPQFPPSDRSVMEHMIYACCLDNTPHEAADEAFARLQQSYFDWNEVRVTTITELMETLKPLPDPANSAVNLKKILQTIFECQYSFDIDTLRKQNLGKATKEIEKYAPNSSFVVAYTVQNALGGHSIPLSTGALSALHILGVATDADIAKKHVPGVERAIPKSKGPEFASLIHQLGADCFASTFSPRVRSILLEIAPDAKDRFPKRQSPKKETSDSHTEGTSTTSTSSFARSEPPKQKKKVAPRTGSKKLTKRKPR